jgi:hypothetical protein
VTADEIVDEVRAGAGIDIDNAATRVSRWLNHLIREMAAESEWIKGTPDLGPTVASQAAYTLPANVVRVYELRVNGGKPYVRHGTRAEWELASDMRYSTGERGFFSESFDDSGSTKQVVLNPAPTEAGQPIEALAALYPNEISGTDEPPFPREFDFALVHGATAIGLRMGDEDHQSAAEHQAIYVDGKLKLKALALKRTSSDDAYIQVERAHF